VGQIFLIPHRPNQPAARHGAREFPCQPPKIMHWMNQVTWDVFEAVIWSLCWLDILILSHTAQTSVLQDMDEPMDSTESTTKYTSHLGSIILLTFNFFWIYLNRFHSGLQNSFHQMKTMLLRKPAYAIWLGLLRATFAGLKMSSSQHYWTE
jgi:hypothetical protein